MEEITRDYQAECENLENEVAALRSQVETLNNVNSNLQQYCNNIATELNNTKEENIILMRRIIMYQDKEIEGFKASQQ